ncbi:preprotein translocase subunit SecY [Cytophagaceae bacterium ABcell3]|nr:preprotein translocase subunit SecY [Cytophagaceae bacterium ABcell3]
MKKFIQTIRDIFSIEDLRIRILNTLGYLVIFRLGSFVVLPGVNPDTVGAAQDNNILGLFDTLLGGAFSNVSVFGLGIMPYISASIVMQLLTFAVPTFQKMQKEGDSGRKKINQITRVLTVAICLAQGIGYLSATVTPDMLYPGGDTVLMNATRLIVLVSGTIFTMWLGEKITDRGIGNGISMLIMIGIISRFPQAIIIEALARELSGAFIFLIEMVALFFVIMGVVMLTQAIRKIPVQYAKQVVGNKVYGGQRQYIPLKVIAAGVMPIIFAQSIMFLPAMIASIWADTSDLAGSIGATFADFTSWQYNVVFAILIILFTFFYTALTVNPNQIADDLKRNGGFVPGVKPGKATSEFIDSVLSKITLPGSVFLAVVAILPAIAAVTGITREFSYFYGGTSLLIMVSVILDTIQQIDSYLLMRNYEGMMKSGRLKGRSSNNIAAAS